MYTSKRAKIVFLILMVLAAGQLFAQRKITIKLASIAPENTPWGEALNYMAAQWSRVTNGEVELVVYHGGIAGDEAEALRRLRVNQIQAAVFTNQGIKSVMPEIITVSYPLLIRNDAELEEVLSKIRPELDARMARNGFVTLAWTRAGWVQLYSKNQVFTPNDVRRQKMATSPDDLEFMQAFRVMGYQLVPVHMNDILVSMNSGMTNATYLSPVMMAASQLFAVANNMIDLNIAPFMGGILMNQTAWRRIPERHQNAILAVCKRVETEMETSISRLESEALAGMVRCGLRSNRRSPAQVQEWYDEIARHENNLAGPIFDRELYLRIKGILEEYRRGR
jgi:TRAP-type C4-dicarboxylate transport system substrate-binding protein